VKAFDFHVHLGDIFHGRQIKPKPKVIPTLIDLAEMMHFANVYLGRVNWWLRPLVAWMTELRTPLAQKENLLRAEDESCISRAGILPLEPYVPTQSVIDLCREHPDRLVPDFSFSIPTNKATTIS
jgi:hypothetical protein